MADGFVEYLVVTRRRKVSQLGGGEKFLIWATRPVPNDPVAFRYLVQPTMTCTVRKVRNLYHCSRSPFLAYRTIRKHTFVLEVEALCNSVINKTSVSFLTAHMFLTFLTVHFMVSSALELISHPIT